MKSFKIKYICLQFHPATLEVFIISKLLSFQFKSPIPFYFVLKNILNSKHVFSKLTQNQGDTKIELRLNKKHEHSKGIVNRLILFIDIIETFGFH